MASNINPLQANYVTVYYPYQSRRSPSESAHGILIGIWYQNMNAIHLYGMQRKEFKSRLFKKKIKPDEIDYWFFLYAETLYRLKQLKDLKCTCCYCFSERLKLQYLIHQMEEEGYIPQNPKANKITGKGDCGRRLGPVA